MNNIVSVYTLVATLNKDSFSIKMHKDKAMAITNRLMLVTPIQSPFILDTEIYINSTGIIKSLNTYDVDTQDIHLVAYSIIADPTYIMPMRTQLKNFIEYMYNNLYINMSAMDRNLSHYNMKKEPDTMWTTRESHMVASRPYTKGLEDGLMARHDAIFRYGEEFLDNMTYIEARGEMFYPYILQGESPVFIPKDYLVSVSPQIGKFIMKGKK